MLKKKNYIIYIGEKFQVEFYFTDKGEMPAKEYFDMSDLKAQAKLLALIHRISEDGKLYDETKFRTEDKKNKIYAFKPLADRYFTFFYHDKKIIITNAYKKQKQTVDKQALKKAIDYKKKYTKRRQEDKYYD